MISHHQNFIDYSDYVEQKMFYERVMHQEYPIDFFSGSAIENLTSLSFYADEELELDLKVPDRRSSRSRTNRSNSSFEHLKKKKRVFPSDRTELKSKRPCLSHRVFLMRLEEMTLVTNLNDAQRYKKSVHVQ
jgi:hypothetical protein